MGLIQGAQLSVEARPAVSVALPVPTVTGNILVVRIWADCAPCSVTDAQGSTFTLVGHVRLTPRLRFLRLLYNQSRLLRRILGLPHGDVLPRGDLWEWWGQVGSSSNNMVTVSGVGEIYGTTVLEVQERMGP